MINHGIAIFIGITACFVAGYGMLRYFNGIDENRRRIRAYMNVSYAIELLPIIQILLGFVQLFAALMIWFW